MMQSPTKPNPHAPPSSILIVGAGAFGLSTAHALASRPHYQNTHITLLDACPISADSQPPPHTASSDTTRLVRADYADAAYAELAHQAQQLWRGEWGADGRYTESGLVLTAEGAAGVEYWGKSRENVKALAGDSIKELDGPEEIAKAMRAPGLAVGSGETGYFNPACGWVDATAAMAWLRGKVANTKRVHFITGEATRLLHDRTPNRIDGVVLASGEHLLADLTILATGAWTGKLVDMRGVASATGQAIAYYTIPAETTARLKDTPVHINMSTGVYFFPAHSTPSSPSGEIKIARHAYGYTNPTSIPTPLSPPPSQGQNITISLPTYPPHLPPADSHTLLTALTSALPGLHLPPTTQPTRSRLCWYLDSRTGDFIVCAHPTFRASRSLFIATAGSGHAFKFLPVLGERIVDVLSGADEGVWTRKWAWPDVTEDGGEVWCEDGSRAGERGVTVEEGMKGVTGKVPHGGSKL